MNETSFEKQNRFAERMTDILNYGALNLAMALGYNTRLFDVMDGFESPQPASDLAYKAGLNERYVREWLGVMVSGEIVELSQNASGDDLFNLPRSHADLITRRAGNSNLGVYTQEIPLLTACAMAPVLQGFYSGDGVDYSHYPKFHEFMAQLASAKHRDVLVNKFLPSVKGGRLIERLESGIRVCDLGCAEGIAIILMAESFPNSEFIGIDISNESLEKARNEASRKGLKNLSFHNLDASRLKDSPGLPDSFDYVTAFDAIRAHGGRPANYCEVGGNPSVRKVKELTKLLLSKPGVEKIAVIMNVVSNTRVDLMARGIVKGILEAGKVPSETVATFRVPGAWEDEGYKILTKYGIEYADRTVSIDEAAALAVRRLQSELATN